MTLTMVLGALRRTMSRTTACMVKYGPRRFTAMCASNSSGVVSRSVPRVVNPTEFTPGSRCGRTRRQRPARPLGPERRRSRRLARSARLSPARPARRQSFSPGSRRRPVTTTWAPSRTAARAIPCPQPLASAPYEDDLAFAQGHHRSSSPLRAVSRSGGGAVDHSAVGELRVCRWIGPDWAMAQHGWTSGRWWRISKESSVALGRGVPYRPVWAPGLLVRHAGRLSRLPEVVDRPALDVLLQCLERAATGLRHLRDDEDQRDRTDGGEQEEHPGDPDCVDERGEEQREEPVRGPPEEHRDADPQAAHVQREDLHCAHPHRDVEEGLHREDEGHPYEQQSLSSQRIPDRQQHRCELDEQMAGRGQGEEMDEGLATLHP